jgi:hypothetical protein
MINPRPLLAAGATMLAMILGVYALWFLAIDGNLLLAGGLIVLVALLLFAAVRLQPPGA